MSPIGSLDLSVFSNGASQGKNREKNNLVRGCVSDENWVIKKKKLALHKWADKGAYGIWRKDEKGNCRHMSKAITDVDFARHWGVKVNEGFRPRASAKRGQMSSSSSSSGRNKR